MAPLARASLLEAEPLGIRFVCMLLQESTSHDLLVVRGGLAPESCQLALRMRVRPVQASSAAAAAQQSRFRALRCWLPPCGHVHGGAGHDVGCRTAFGVPAQPLHLSAIVDSRLAC